MIVQWNGASWTLVPSPGAGVLNSVSCTSATVCVAVGSDNGQALIEQWNGTTWSIVPSPSVGSGQSVWLNQVSCVAASTCVSVGSFGPSGSPLKTLVEQWDGTSWSIVPSPDESPDESDALNGVSCTASSACTATGIASNSQALVEHWDGSVWTIVATPTLGTQAGLNGVSLPRRRRVCVCRECR